MKNATTKNHEMVKMEISLDVFIMQKIKVIAKREKISVAKVIAFLLDRGVINPSGKKATA